MSNEPDSVKIQALKNEFITAFIESATMEDIDELIEIYWAQEKPTQTLAILLELQRQKGLAYDYFKNVIEYSIFLN
jgi:hypothetical protein